MLNNNLPLCPRQLDPRQVPFIAHMRQDLFSAKTLGILGALATPPAFCLE